MKIEQSLVGALVSDHAARLMIIQRSVVVRNYKVISFLNVILILRSSLTNYRTYFFITIEISV